MLLAGINVALLDSAVVTPSDLSAQFFLRPEHVGMNVRPLPTHPPIPSPTHLPTQRAEACLPGVQEMNPLASVECHTTHPSALPDSFFSAFDVIVASDLPPSQLLRLDQLARAAGKTFMYADTFAFHGWAFLDLGPSFQGRLDDAKPNPDGTTAPVKEFNLSYPPLHDTLAVPWSALKTTRFSVPRVFVMGRLLNLYEEKHNARPSSSSSSSIDSFITESKQALVANGLEETFLSDEELRYTSHPSTHPNPHSNRLVLLHLLLHPPTYPPTHPPPQTNRQLALQSTTELSPVCKPSLADP